MDVVAPARPMADPGAPGDPDRELVLAALAEYPRGTRWFSELVTIHWDLVWTLCQAALLDERAAENAATLAFLRAHRRLETCRTADRFTAWLGGIAREVADEALAERLRGPASGGAGWVGAWLAGRRGFRLGRRAPGPSPRRIFARLEVGERRLLALRCMEDLPGDEVAAAIGADPGRIGTLLAAACARLAALSGPAGGPAGPAPAARRPGPDGLGPREVALVRAAIGTPDRERIVRAMDDIERQVALEDVVVMLARSVVEAGQEFLDLLGQVHAGGAGRPPAEGTT